MSRRLASCGQSRRQSRGAVEVPFTPTSLANCILWLDANQGVTTVTGDVSAWADQSGAGNDFAQGTSGLRPALDATGGPNGGPAVDFRGLSRNEGLASSSSIAMGSSTGVTFVVVMNYDDFTASPIWLEMSTTYSSNTGAAAVTYSNGLGQQLMNADDGTTLSQWKAATGDIVTGTWYRNVNEHDITRSTNETRIYIDNVQSGVIHSDGNLSGTYNDFVWYLGGRGAAHTLPLDGQICEVLAYNRVITAAERTQLDGYLVVKYGL